MERLASDDLSNFRFDTMKLIQCFMKYPIVQELGVKPSEYINELQLPYKERSAKLKFDCDKLFDNAPPAAIYERWDVRPRFVLFNNCAPWGEYEAFFSVRNKYRTSKMLKAHMAPTEVFSVEEMLHLRRVASMVTVTFKVKFKPRDNKDYLHSVTLTAEGDSFPIFILAIGPRPLINFPDAIDFGEVLVNYKNEKKIQIKNIGKIRANVNLETIGKVTLTEEKISLNADDEYCLTITLYSKTTGFFNSQIIATYETGERVYINVTGDCVVANIHLEKQKVLFEKTYIGLKSTKTLLLRNDTDKILKFQWLRTEDVEEDKLLLKRYGTYLKRIYDFNRKKWSVLKDMEISNQAEHESIIDKVFEEETQNVKHVFYFVDSSIHINPTKGTLWSHSEIIFLITFLPTKLIPYMTLAHLEVEGLLNRLKITFEGQAIGPNIALNISTIDIGKIFISSLHTCAIMATNVGHVKGTLRFKPKDTLCGGKITCEPSLLELDPEETKSMAIKITSIMTGHFVEDVHFLIDESCEELLLTMKGEIINPTLTIDKKKIDFGKIALGIPASEKLLMRNESAVQVEVKMQVEGDGTMPVVRIDRDIELFLPSNPKEFDVQPSSAIIESGANLEVEVIVVSNRVRRHSTSLLVYLWGVLVEEACLKLSYESQIPRLTVNPPELVLRYAFTGYEYCHKLTVCNESNLPTYFFMLPQESDYNPFIIYRLENESGYLQDQACQLVSVYIKVLTVKPSNERIRLRVFGLNNIVQACTIRAYGMGPVVNPSSFSMNWGQIPIMEKVEKKLQLINVSPIPAYYKMDFMKRLGVWQTNHPKGSIHPDSSVEVILTAEVRDNGPISDQLWVEISGSRDINVDLTASGQGISIFTEPPIFPLYDIGTVFRREKQKQIIKVKNVGTKHHTLLFTTTKDFKKMTKLTAAKEQGQYFKLNPYRLDLPGGSVEEIVLSFKWDEEAVLEDTYYCYGTIGNTGKRITFGTSTIRASFTDPQFIFEPKQVYFRIDLSEEDTIIEPLHQIITLKSLWNTKLDAECKLNPPFRFSSVSMVDRKPSSLDLGLEPGKVYTLDLYFEPPNAKSRRNRVIRDVLLITYTGHTVKTSINLIGEMNYPNLSISVKQIHLGCVPPGGEGISQVQLKNVSPLTVRFEWVWEKVSTFSNLKVIEDPQKITSIVTDTFSEASMTESTNFEEISDNEGRMSESAASFRKWTGEKIFKRTERNSIYRNILTEKYYIEDGNLPKNLEVIVTELLSAKYEYEKKVIEQRAKKKENWKVQVYNQFCGVKEQRGSGSIWKSTDLSKIPSISSVDSVDTESSCILSEELKVALDLASQDSSGSSAGKLENLLTKIPQEVELKDTLLNLSKSKKKEDILDQPRKDLIPEISKIIDISPKFDILEPKDCLWATLTFRPKVPIWVEASALCKVGGGPSEILYFTAYSYPLMYEVYPKLINFGIGPFCEVWYSSILVRNKSLKEINVVVSTPCELTFRKKQENPNILPHSVGVNPSQKTVKPFEASFHEILLYPGHVGEIDQLIFVEIDNEEPVHIHFVGYAVPHQIHLGLPHLIEVQDPLNMYHSIARMTSNWFKLDLKEILNWQMTSEELEDILIVIQDKYYEGDWDLLMTQDDLVPTVDDINMAYERFLCEQYRSQFAGVIPHHSLGDHKYFGGLFLPSYSVDFGLVIAGTKAVCNVPYTNYFPIRTDIKIIHPKDKETLDKFGVTIKLPSTVSLKGYEEKVFEIFIRPTKDVFQNDEFEKEMNFDFHIEVACGGIIPIAVKALITVPVLVTPNIIDFEGVKIGYQRTIKFKLKNVSKVDCEWIGVLSTSNSPVYYLSRKAKTTPKNCPFFIKPVYGYLNPKHYTIISVVFEPQHEIPSEVDIHFYTNMNNRYSKVRLRGFGMEPRLLIRDVSFGYSIPYSKPVKKRLTVYNPTLFPVEVFIYGEDSKQKLETKVATSLLSYYGTSKLSVPSCFFSTHATDNMWKMYENLAIAAIHKYAQDTFDFLSVIVKQSLSKTVSKGLKSSSESSIISTHKIKKRLVPAKSFSLGKGRDIRKIEKFSRISFSYSKSDLVDVIIQKHLSKKPLQDILKDYVNIINHFNCPRANLIETQPLLEENDENVMKDGNIVIVHPSPFSYPGTFTWLLAKHTGMQPISIDNVIYTEIKRGRSEESLSIRDALYNYYYEEKQNISLMFPEYTLRKKEYERLNFPIKTIEGLIKFATRNYFGRGREASGFGLSSTKTKQDKTASTLLNISIEYFQAIFKRRLVHKLQNGIIIKTLSSQFFSTPVVTLNLLLDLFKCYQNLNVISLYSSIEHHMKLNKKAINPALIEYFQGATGKNILEASASFVKKFGDEFYDQRRILNKPLTRSSMKRDKAKKQRSSKMSTYSYYYKSKVKPKILRSLRVMELENVFATYQKELAVIRDILEAYERYSAKNNSGSSASSSLSKIKKTDFMKKLPNMSLSKVDIMTDDRIGIPFWILYNYPYSQEYQFSVFPDFLSSIESIKKYSCYIKPKELNSDILSKKSYFAITSLKSREDNSQTTLWNEGAFKLQPIIKYKKKKELPLKTSSYEELKPDVGRPDSMEKEAPKIKRYFSSPSGSGGSKNSDKLNFIQMRISKHCAKLEDDLLTELVCHLQKRCRNKATRQIVKPGKFVSWEVQFEPVGCRYFTQCIPFGISGCNTVKCVNIFGGSDIPDISFDPYVMFPQVITECKDIENVFFPCYILEGSIFHFGKIIVSSTGNHNNESQSEGNQFMSTCDVKIQNISNVNVSLTITLIAEDKFYSHSSDIYITHRHSVCNLRRKMHSNINIDRKGKQSVLARRSSKKNPVPLANLKGSPQKRKNSKTSLEEKRIFQCNVSELAVPVGVTETIVISSSPVKPGLQAQMYMLSIENNPKVYILKAMCNGIIVKVDFRPKEIIFEEVVLYRTSTKCFLLDNVSKVPLMWKVLDVDTLSPLILLSKYEGSLNPTSQETVSVTYQANSIERTTKDLTIVIFSPLKKNVELQRYVYKLLLKSYSVDVNFHFEMSGNDHLTLVDVGIGESIGTKLIIQNSGPHPITYLVLINDAELIKVKQDFTVAISNETGSLRSKDSCNIEITISCGSEMALKSVAFLIIEVYDYGTEELIARIPGYISLCSLYPDFVLKPTQYLHFGDLEIGSSKSLELILENTGSINLNYAFKLTERAMVVEGEDQYSYKVFNTNKVTTQTTIALSHTSITVNITTIDSSKRYVHEFWDGTSSKNPEGNLERDGPRHTLKLLKKLAQLKKILLLHGQKLFYKNMYRKLKIPFQNVPKKQLDEYIAQLKKLRTKTNVARKRKVFKPSVYSPSIGAIDDCPQLDGSTRVKSFSSFYAPPFKIFPGDGILEAGKYTVCTVNCIPLYPGHFRTVVNLKIQNAHPERSHLPVEMNVTCSQPKVNFDYNSVFRDFVISDNSSVFSNDRFNQEGMPYGIFNTLTKRVRFCNVPTGSTESFNIYLKSETHLVSKVTVSIAGDKAFIIKNEDIIKITIPPYETLAFPIIFSPIDLTECRGQLELNLKSNKNINISSVNYLLRGQGCIPSICIEQPMCADEVSYPMPHITKIDFEYVHLNNSSTKIFSVVNSGNIICDFWLDVSHTNGVFKVNAGEEAMKACLNSSISDHFDSSTLFRIKPSDKISFEAEYSPVDIGLHSMQIPVHIVYNPYELINVKFVGECYQNDITIQGLECISLSSSIGAKANIMEYKLDFGSCSLGGKYQKKFIIQNNTLHIMRFEFVQESHDIIFIPSMGHIYHASKKEVIALFLANNIHNLKADMSLTYNGLAYKDDPINNCEWDNSQKIISQLEDKKILLDMDETIYFPLKDYSFDEPECALLSLISGAVYLVGTAIVDKPVLEVTVSDVSFLPVLVGQISSLSFRVTNRCNIEINFEITIMDREEEKYHNFNITDISYGKFSYDLQRFMNLENETIYKAYSYNWPAKLPPDLELYDYCSLFLKREKKSDLEKWEYLKVKHVSQLHAMNDFNESQTLLKGTNLGDSSDSFGQDSSETLLSEKERKTQLEIPLDMEIRETKSSKCCVPSSFWTDIRCGKIKPSETLEIKIMFSPCHIVRYESDLSLTANDGSILKTINLSGIGFLPLCHIEIEEHDNAQPRKALIDPLPYRTKSVVITTFSSDSIIKESFKVYNITEIPFHFKWYCLKNSPKEPKFKCFTEEGTIYPRGSGEMLFSFCPVEHGTYESLWLLCIREFILLQPIIFVGTSKEPVVTVSPKSVKLRPTFKSTKTCSEIKVINQENVTIRFSVKEEPTDSNSVYNRIHFIPLEGEIMPNSYTTLLVEYNPDKLREESVPFSLCIEPSKRNIPFTVIITKFTIIPLVSCLKENLEKFNIAYEDKKNNVSINTISIGKISVRNPYKLIFTIKNMGEIPFHYELFASEEKQISLEIEQTSGLVLPKKHHSLFVSVATREKVAFKQLITIKISKGPTFNAQICGSASSPLYDFSFDQYDFGTCIIQKCDQMMYSTVLQFFNSEFESVLLETKGCKEVFSVNLKSLLVDPRTVHKIVIVFNPVEAVRYQETLTFYINSTFQHNITLTGEGDDFYVEIDSPENQLVDLGLVKTETLAYREITLINKSRALSFFTLYLKERNETMSSVKLELKPAGKPVKLKPRETCTVQISFYGAERLKDYSAAVVCKAYGEQKILFCIKASVIDYEFSVDQKSLLFGPTTIGCSNVLKFALKNTGDIGARYKIDTNLLSEVFAVKPVNGYSPPGSITVIEVTFIPNTATQYYNNMLICLIKDYHPMTINITGIGVRISAPMSTVKFNTDARQKVKQLVTLKNSSQVEQILYPIVDGAYFSGPESIKVPPRGEADYEITYNPKTQTLHHHHLGSVFCAYPDGQSCLLKLIGSAVPPKSSSSESWNCFARQRFKGLLSFENWTTVPQTFTVELVFLTASTKIFCVLEADEAISIPAKAERKFPIGILCYKDCFIEFEARFKNVVTGECKKYLISVTVAPYNIPKLIKLKSCAQQKINHRIALFNPMNKSTTFVFQSPSPDITPKSKLIRVKPGKKKFLKLSYLPLEYGFSAVFSIEIHNGLLGILSEEVSFIGSMKAEAEVTLEAHISSPASFSIPIKNPSSQITSCFAQANSNDLCIKNELFSIPSGKKYYLHILFSPSFVGEALFNIVVFTDKIKKINIIAKCIGLPPKPQGFIIVPRGSLYKIIFENVLKAKATFLCESNNQEFMVRTPGFTLSPGEAQTVEILHIPFYNTYNVVLGSEDSCCKISVICTSRVPGLLWTYYLRATIDK